MCMTYKSRAEKNRKKPKRNRKLPRLQEEKKKRNLKKQYEYSLTHAIVNKSIKRKIRFQRLPTILQQNGFVC